MSVSPALNINYLGISISPFRSKVKGVIWGYGKILFVSLPVRLYHKNCPNRQM